MSLKLYRPTPDGLEPNPVEHLLVIRRPLHHPHQRRSVRSRHDIVEQIAVAIASAMAGRLLMDLVDCSANRSYLFGVEQRPLALGVGATLVYQPDEALHAAQDHRMAPPPPLRITHPSDLAPLRHALDVLVALVDEVLGLEVAALGELAMDDLGSVVGVLLLLGTVGLELDHPVTRNERAQDADAHVVADFSHVAGDDLAAAHGLARQIEGALDFARWPRRMEYAYGPSRTRLRCR